MVLILTFTGHTQRCNFVWSCETWQYFQGPRASRGLSATVELLV